MTPTRRLVPTAALLTLLALAPAVRAADDNLAPPISQGQRVFTAGHSFHVFLPKYLTEMAAAAGIDGHRQLGLQSIGGSYVHQHWNRPDEQNLAKKALATGEVDVLTLSPIYLPDDGIERFVALALEKNPNARVTIQEFWLPFDVYAPEYKQKRPPPVDRNSRTGDELRQISAPYFRSMEDHVRELNKKHGKAVVFPVPVGQAAIALREKIIAGQAPGLKSQEDLFTDAIGHAKPPLQALAAYCHFAVIYRRSPVGLPEPAALKGQPELNRLLQELAWDAVRQHPLAGVRRDGDKP